MSRRHVPFSAAFLLTIVLIVVPAELTKGEAGGRLLAGYTGGAKVSLQWKSSSQTFKVVPRIQLVPQAIGVRSPAPTRTRTRTPTRSATPSPTRTTTPTRTRTATPKQTRTSTRTATRTPTKTATRTVTRTSTRTAKRTAARTAKRTATRTATRAATAAPTLRETLDYSPFLGLDFGVREIFRDRTAVKLAQNSGATWVRGSVNWATTEPVKGTFNFTNTDAFYNTVTNAGFSALLFVSNNPTWAANTPCGPIDTNDSGRMEAFSAFMATLAARYPQVKVWSLYNEPDNSDFVRTGTSSGGCFGDDTTNDLNRNGVNDRADYARMLATAWKAVHHANPNAQLAMGAVAYDFFDSRTFPTWYGHSHGSFNYFFLPELFAYIAAHPLPKGERYMDLLMFNYYDSNASQWQKVEAGYGIQAKTGEIEEQMANYSLSFSLAVTETGVDSRGAGTQGQASCLTITMVRGKTTALRGLMWWTFLDLSRQGYYYGIVDAHLAPKPAYYALKTLRHELSGYSYNATRTNSLGLTDIEAYEFKRGTTTKTVLWSDAIVGSPLGWTCAKPRSNRTATFGSTVARLGIVDLTGSVSVINDNRSGDLDTRSGYIGISVDGRPKFVQPNP